MLGWGFSVRGAVLGGHCRKVGWGCCGLGGGRGGRMSWEGVDVRDCVPARRSLAGEGGNTDGDIDRDSRRRGFGELFDTF